VRDAEMVRAPETESALLSANADASVASSFQALAQTMLVQNHDMMGEAVREMMRPMLKQWLDDNLPVLVERLVRAEIERVARGGR
jgi:cell pole-organizing protein PopZ